MNKLFVSYIILFSVCLSTIHSLYAAQNTTFTTHSTSVPFIRCAPQLKKHLQALLKIPEAKVLIEGIQKDGPIQIIAKETELTRRFGAFWDPDRRIICIDISSDQSEGELIGSLLFELHNASVNSQFDRLDEMAVSGKITKEKYIESMEYIEYLNSLSASKIADKGMRTGVLPLDSGLPIYPNFKEHFRAQKSSGHSACFARNFDKCLRQVRSQIVPVW